MTVPISAIRHRKGKAVVKRRAPASEDSTRRSSSARVRPAAPCWARTRWRPAAPRAAAASGSSRSAEQAAGQVVGVGDPAGGVVAEELLDRVAEVGGVRAEHHRGADRRRAPSCSGRRGRAAGCRPRRRRRPGPRPPPARRSCRSGSPAASRGPRRPGGASSSRLRRRTVSPCCSSHRATRSNRSAWRGTRTSRRPGCWRRAAV